ncbi:MAG: hypothetical protein FDW93_02165 [Bergeyella sp.]|nr:hypothetical protein [Bergeyella sp.]
MTYSFSVRLHVGGEKRDPTLFRLLNSSKFSVFDINLRAPHYEVDCVLDLMKKSHLVKMNEEELTLLVKHFGYEISDPEKMVRRMAKVCGLKIFCVTLGEKGALLLKGKQIHKHEGYCVEVEDTVGAGDNFLAGMIYKYLLKRKGSEILEFACAAGALAATKKGSPPNISKQNIDDFIEQNKV